MYTPSTPDDHGGRPPEVGELIEAARLLGVVTVPDPAVHDLGRPADVLALSAIVLGAAENQVVQAEQAAVDAGGGLDAVCGAADLTARLMCQDNTWQTRQWLGWHTGRLVHQLEQAHKAGHLPEPAADAAAECGRAMLVLLRHYIVNGGDPELPRESRDRFRAMLTAALRRLDDP